jgi:S-adenosylmethionine/arginine decarboxylase-like enzyme
MTVLRWGYHLALDIGKCYSPSIRCTKHITAFTKTLVKEIDMKAYGEPLIVHFGEGNKSGYTLIQLIETSNIAGHFCEETDDLYLDVFSCKEFDKEVVKKVVNQYFMPLAMKEHYMERQAPYISKPDLP